MRQTLTRVRTAARQKTQAIECCLIVCSCIFVYLANDQLISSNDSIPNTLLAFNWLQNHTLHFDSFRGSHYYLPNDVFGPDGIPYFFVEAPNGHLTSSYPIGVAVVSFPLYFLFFIYLKLHIFLQSGILELPTLSLNITDPSFETQRYIFEKLASAILAGISTVIFYLLIRLNFSRAVSWIAAFIYAFGTLNWVVCSQGLWPHTASNLVLASAMLCLFKASRVDQHKRMLLLAAGFFCGLLPGIRPTSLLFSLAILLYSGLTHKREAVFVLLGCCSALFNIAWNIYYFGFSVIGLIAGGYSNLLAGSSGSYEFTTNYIKEAFLGLLISPSRGFFIFSPVLLFALPGIFKVFRKWADRDEKLIAFLAIACLALFTHYCFYMPWWGAITYGSRFLTDTLPVICYLICYFLRDLFVFTRQIQPVKLAICTIFFTCLTFSTGIQTVGAFSDSHVWDTAPLFDPSRFWDWRDSQIERHTRNLLLKVEKPIQRPRRYLRRASGVINIIKNENNQPLSHTVCVNPSQQIVLQAEVQNTGASPWFGYNTGLFRGRTAVKVRFFDRAKQAENAEKTVSTNLLYVAGTPKRGETATAIGVTWFPQAVGEYKMTFELAAEGMGSFSKRSPQSVYELKANVTADPVSPGCSG